MANTQIKSSKSVKVLVDTQGFTNHSTTILYKDRRFKLVSNHRNGDESVIIYMFTESNGWVFLYGTEEIQGVENIRYVKSYENIEILAVQNYYAMVEHLKKVFG